MARQVSSENSLFCLCIPKFRIGDGVLVQMGRSKAPAQVTAVETVSRTSTSLTGDDALCCKIVDAVICGYTKPKRYSVRFEKGGARKMEHNVPGERMEHFRAEITVGAELVSDDEAEEAARAVATVAAIRSSQQEGGGVPLITEDAAAAEAVAAAADAAEPKTQP